MLASNLSLAFMYESLLLVKSCTKSDILLLLALIDLVELVIFSISRLFDFDTSLFWFTKSLYVASLSAMLTISSISNLARQACDSLLTLNYIL